MATGICYTLTSLLVWTSQAAEVSILLCNHNPGRVLHLNQSDLSVTEIAAESHSKPFAIEYDPVEQMIYWTDVGLKQIRRANLKGQNQSVLLQLNQTAKPDGLALDVRTRTLFYTDKGNDIIAAMDLTGRNRKVIIGPTFDLDDPRAIVLEGDKRWIYWSDWGTKPYIAKASYEGRNIQKIVTTGLYWPNGLAIDIQKETLYWCDGKLHKIESVSLDGTQRRQLLYEAWVHYMDVFFFEDILYFTDWKDSAVFIMPASGGSVSNISSSLITQPLGLHVFKECVPNTYGPCHPCGHCAGGSVCNRKSGYCRDGCQPGWRGERCDAACPSNTYGFCVSCGSCANDDLCNKVTGFCPNGCLVGWTGHRCDTVCPNGTYGQTCEDCGHCAKGVPCDKASAECLSGCAEGWSGLRCMIRHDDHNPTSDDSIGVPQAVIIGTSFGVGFILLVVVIIIVVTVLLRRKKISTGQPQPEQYYATVEDSGQSVEDSGDPGQSNINSVPVDVSTGHSSLKDITTPRDGYARWNDTTHYVSGSEYVSLLKN